MWAWRKFIALRPADRICLIEAAVLLGVARLALLVLPFRRFARLLGREQSESEETPSEPDDAVRRVAWSLRVAGRRLPRRSRCLVQAAAGKIMLARRGYPSTVYLGVARDAAGGVKAHAWLRQGRTIVTGGPGRRRFQVISAFS